jgi:hypothetical protein
LIERYGREFDPTTGTGGIELWLPMRHEGDALAALQIS